MKRIIVLSLLVSIMIISTVACGKKEEGADNKVDEKKIENIEEAYESEI